MFGATARCAQWCAPRAGRAAGQHPTSLYSPNRVLDFPGSAVRRPTIARSGTLPVAGAAAVAAVPASSLRPEPAYKSALERLSQAGSRPSSAGVATAAAVAPMPNAASERLQALLQSVRASAAAARPATAATTDHDLPPRLPLAPTAQQQQVYSTSSVDSRHAAEKALQERLKQRIEQAKADIRSQLSPMFRLSDALLGAADPLAAASVLDAALVGVENGIGRGSSSGGAVCSSAMTPQLQHARVSQLGTDSVAAGSGIPSATQHRASEDVDSLVLSARAAVSKAQRTIANLSSPPKQAPAGNSAAAAGAAPAPYMQLTVTANRWPPPGQQQLAAGNSGGGELAPTSDLEGRLAELRAQSEALIREEAERLISGLNGVFADFLSSMQQHRLVVRLVAPGGSNSSSSSGMQPHLEQATGGADADVLVDVHDSIQQQEQQPTTSLQEAAANSSNDSMQQQEQRRQQMSTGNFDFCRLGQPAAASVVQDDPLRQQALGFEGFGSPIKLARSVHASPAKTHASSMLPGFASPAQHAPPAGMTGSAAVASPRARPLFAASSPAASAHYFTTRSRAGSSATSPAASTASGSSGLLRTVASGRRTTARRDLDATVASIKRLAAEVALRQPLGGGPAHAAGSRR